MSYGLTIPFQQSTGSLGYFRVTNDEISALNQDINSILITNWGERVMHYNFGCNLREFLFEPKTGDEIKLKIADRILTQISLWLPFLSIHQLNILTSEDDKSLGENDIKVYISYFVKTKPDLAGQQTFIVGI